MITAIVVYVVVGFALALGFAAWSNKNDAKEFGDWRNPATPAMSLAIMFVWPMAVPVIALLVLFHRAGA